jgi:hypothetical protein
MEVIDVDDALLGPVFTGQMKISKIEGEKEIEF